MVVSELTYSFCLFVYFFVWFVPTALLFFFFFPLPPSLPALQLLKENISFFLDACRELNVPRRFMFTIPGEEGVGGSSVAEERRRLFFYLFEYSNMAIQTKPITVYI